MIPELGHFALIFALLVALAQGTLPLIGAQIGERTWMALARPLAQALFVLTAVSFACLAASFLHDDFTVLYVAEHSNSHLPEIYKFAAVWGGHEGSFLLWLLMLAGWTLAVALFSRSLPDEMVARVIGVLGLVAAGFLLFVLLTSNPFARLLPGVQEGRDLNPMLQDPGLVAHPPMLYMGYVGSSVTFAFALAALLAGRLDAAWARWSRPWTLAAWVSLTIGITLGSYWAYYVLGWGGWWFWDPVENASFMPWLFGTALIHSLAVTEKRGTFRNWTVLLAIGAFSLSLLGTFLVRSGVLTSVHAFANDPKRGAMILVLLSLVIGASLVLFAWRAPKVGVGGRFGLFSREAFLLTNNILLVVAAAAVLLGTLYPLIVDALGLGKLSVGPPYFNKVFVPIALMIALFAAIGPLLRWKQDAAPRLTSFLVFPAVCAVLGAIFLPFLAGAWSWSAALGAGFALGLIGSIADQIRLRLRGGWPTAAYWGMQLAHFGFAIAILGVSFVKSYESERDVRMEPGDTTSAGGYTFRFRGVSERMGPNYRATVGEIELLRDGAVVGVMRPEKRDYFSSGMPMTDTAIDSGFLRDLYVSLGEPLDGGAWAVRVYYKPLVNWIWGGAVMMALGGAFAAGDRRYRALKARAATAVEGARA